MDIIEMTITALKKNEFISLLRGDGEYKIETSQYSPDAELTDAGKILSRGIYQCHLVNQFQIKIQWFSFRESHCFFSSKT